MGCITSKVAPEKNLKVKKHSGDKIAEDLNVTFNDLEHIDEHARQTPTSAEKSIDTLATHLARAAKSDLEIIRAFYVWICENIRYNTGAYFYGNRASTTAEDVLHCKTSVCEGYANVFYNLCRTKNIECKRISGFSKGYGHVLGSVISYDKQTNHTWNTVKINGKWRFIETTWGAGHIDGNQQFFKKFSDFYFLTRPEHFISDHFPYIGDDIEASKQWQLLKSPVSLEQFSKSVKLTAHAREFGISFPSHQFEVIDVNKTCSISMQSKQQPVHFGSVKLHDSNGTLCTESAVILKNDGFKYTIVIRPKEPGSYRLAVFGSVEQLSTKMGNLVEYLINCNSCEEDYLPYPNHRGFYGPKLYVQERGFDISKLPKAFYTVKDEEYEIRIPTKMEFYMRAKFYDADGVDRSEYVLLEPLEGEVCVKIRFIQKGYFKLILFSGFEELNSYTEAFNILLLNLVPSTVQKPFPSTFSTTFKYKCQLIEPLVRDLPANSEITLKMSSPVFQQILVNGNVYPKQGNIWNVKLNSGESGNVSISGNDGYGNTYYTVYEFDIKS